MDDTAEQDKNTREWLKPYHFKAGQSGNPSGRPKGTVSLKEYAKQYLRGLSEEEKEKFMEGLDKNEIWRMAEGNPANATDVTSAGEKIAINLVSFDENPDDTSQPSTG